MAEGMVFTPEEVWEIQRIAREEIAASRASEAAEELAEVREEQEDDGA